MNLIAAAAIALVALERAIELRHAASNTRALLADGAHEIGRRHYLLIVLLHASWLAAILLTVPQEAPVSWPLLITFAALQPLRFWTIASLGRFWTTRLITLPSAPAIRAGPYRFIRHPNYLVVAAEIAILPLAFGAWQIAAIFSALNAALLAWRIRLENQALAARR